METLGSSSTLKLFRDNRDRGFFCTKDKDRDAALPKLEIRFFKHLNVASFSLSQTTPHHKPVFSVSSLSSSNTRLTEASVENEETQNINIDQSKTVHVKFQLQRACSFGQRFHIVGDDPAFGLWDPSDAVPLNWSDGHIWIVEMDIPAGKSINYKFILKEGGPGNIIWQPGPDRVLQTWETKNTIIVCEDWENAESRKILEEPTLTQNGESSINAEMLVVAQNLSQPNASQMTEAFQEPTGTNLNEKPIEEKPAADGRPVNVQDSESTKDEGKTLSSNGLPVLVPGLAPLPTSDAEDVSLKEEVNTFANASVDAAKIKDLTVSSPLPTSDAEEIARKEVEANNFTNASGEADKIKNLNVLEDLKEVPESDKQEQIQQNSKSGDKVLENDIQWVGKTLQKLLANFGIQ